MEYRRARAVNALEGGSAQAPGPHGLYASPPIRIPLQCISAAASRLAHKQRPSGGPQPRRSVMRGRVHCSTNGDNSVGDFYFAMAEYKCR